MTLRDADRFKDKIEVSLDSRQIFFLFAGGAVVACLVFVLGVMVGRRLEGREQNARRGAAAAVDPLAALDELGADEKRAKEAGGAGDDLAFHAALSGEPGERTKPLGAADTAPGREPEAPRAGEAGKPDPKAEAAKAEQARLEAAKAEQAKLEAAKAEQARAQAAKAEQAKLEAAKAEQAKAEAAKAEAAKAQAAKTDPKVTKPDEKSAKSDKGDEKKKAKYTLQLSSFQDRGEAEAFAAKVTAAGYRPYIIESNVPDKGIFFRVRLGAYASHEDALAAKNDFEAKQHIIAYVTRL